MPAYWLTFKPLAPDTPLGWPIEKLQDLVRRFEDDPNVEEWWRIASYKAARPGDRVYLFKQGDDPRGIFGVGTIAGKPEERDEPSDTGGLRFRVPIRFERLVDPTRNFLLRLEEIGDSVPSGLIKALASGEGVPEEKIPELERKLSSSLPQSWPPLEGGQGDDPAFDPDSVVDERERAFRAIRIRRGQPAFRSALLKAYGNRCVVTGCAIEDLLEAAHIMPYLGPLTNHPSNGLLLRTDLHTLFDCHLLGIHPETRKIAISRKIMGSAYERFAGRLLRKPLNETSGPTRKNLERRFATFEAIQRR
jgi:hypothetical protein